MTLEEQIDEVLQSMESGELYALTKDTPELLRNAIKKAKAYNLIKPRGNTFDLTDIGHDAIELGGFNAWKLHCKNKNDSTQNNIIVHGDVKESQLGLSSRFGNLESNHNSIARVNVDEIVKPIEDTNTTQKKLSIFQKIYKWTDHKLVSNIIFGILSFLAAIIANYLGWIPCLNK